MLDSKEAGSAPVGASGASGVKKGSDQVEPVSILAELKKLGPSDPKRVPKQSCPTELDSELVKALKRSLSLDHGGNNEASIQFSNEF